jgi:epoxyqueuosine reductase
MLQEKPLTLDVGAMAQAHGFLLMGLSDIDLGYAQPGLKAWLSQGYHGEMNYMAEHGMKRAEPASLVPGTASVLMVAMNYRPHDQDWVESAWQQMQSEGLAYISRYALGRDYHKLVRSRLQKLASALQQQALLLGHALEPVRVFCDSAPVMEVELAKKAGLGWRGKHTLLLNQHHGSMFFLGSLFLGLPASFFRATLPAPQADGAHCGTCQRCIDVCPTQAIIAPYKLDARRCISYLTIEHKTSIPLPLRRAIGQRVYGCDDCQLVCPWNKFARASDAPDFVPRHGLDTATLSDLLLWDKSQFESNLQGSAIRRIGFSRWVRNLAVAAGNSLADHKSDPNKQQQRARLVASLHHRLNSGADELQREHLIWALGYA